MRFLFFILFVTLLTFPNISKAEILIDTTTNNFGANIETNLIFQVSNNTGNPLYLLQVAIPKNSNFQILNINCPEDTNINDNYTWAKSIENNLATCQTSANGSNPNLIPASGNSQISLNIQTPNLTSNKIYNWKISVEDTRNKIAIESNEIATVIDSTPPEINSIKIIDSNDSGLLDKVELTFSEEIDATSLLPEDFQIANQDISNIIQNTPNAIELILENEVENTSTPNISYTSTTQSQSINRLGQTLSNFTNLDNLPVTDNIKPTIIYADIPNQPLRPGTHTLTINFSEQMDNTVLPIVTIKGLKQEYTPTITEYAGASWKGVFELDDHDEISNAQIYTSNAQDKSGNSLTDNTLANTIQVDTLSEATFFDQKPLKLTTDKNATFTLNTNQVREYKYGLNGDNYSSIRTANSAIKLNNLTSGTHILDIMTKDINGNWQDPSVFSWEVLDSSLIIKNALIDTPVTLTHNRANLDTNSTDPRTIQLNQILLDAQGIILRNISTWKNNTRTNDIKNTFEKYTTPLLKNMNNIHTETIDRINYFILYGTPSTLKLGAGERAGILNSYKSAFSKIPQTQIEWEDLIKIGNGRWPSQESQKALDQAKTNFKKIYNRDANMLGPNDNAAVTIMAYGLRPDTRNTDSEKNAIKSFKHIIGHNPTSAIDWDMVRAIAYSGATK